MKKNIIVWSLIVTALLMGWGISRKIQLKPNVESSEHNIDSLQLEGNSVSVSNSLPGSGETERNTLAKAALSPRRRALFKSTNFPPQTVEEKEQWSWWQAMRKSDPQFEWKMPIEFYGKVVDQLNEPVAGAEVELNWTTTIGPVPDPKKTIRADEAGQFAVSGIQGNGITVVVQKEGYRRTRDCIQSFEYAAFYKDNFHIPDSTKPVVFHLHRLIDSEPLYVFSPYGKIEIGGPPLILDVQKGKIGNQGDLAFTVNLVGEVGNHDRDFTLTVRGLNGTGLIQSDEEFLSKAPDSGYQNALSVAHRTDGQNQGPEESMRFYVRTASGNYASVGVSVKLWNDGKKADWEAGVYYNPSGSRNLEFDSDKWINR